jgi:RHS repeat-associated protein
MKTGGNVFYYHEDDQGSVVALTGPAGAITLSYRYDPYGDLRSQVNADPNPPQNFIRYGGQLVDVETGLYNLRAREYDPSLGAFLSVDPRGKSDSRLLLSNFVYTHDRPTVLEDPSGLCAPYECNDEAGGNPSPNFVNEAEAELEAEAKLLAASGIRTGKVLTRYYVGKNGPAYQMGHYWTDEFNPSRDILGLPKENTAVRVVRAKILHIHNMRVTPGGAAPYTDLETGIVFRGGAREIYVPNPTEQLKVISDQWVKLRTW